jgi:DNA-binding transcriptional LysR family regulator
MMETLGNWTTLHRAEAFCVVYDTGDWEAASVVLFGKAAKKKSKDSHRGRTWQLVEEFAEDLYSKKPPPKLFEHVPVAERKRGERSLRVTQYGERAVLPAKRFVNASHSLRSSAQGTGALRLVCYPAHINAIVGRLMKLAPMDLEVREDLHLYRRDRGEAMFHLLETGECDIIIAPACERPLISSSKLYAWKLVAVAPVGLWEDSTVAIKDVLGQPLLLSPSNHVSRELV